MWTYRNIASSILALVGAGIIALFIFTWLAMRIQEVPTCAVYSFNLRPAAYSEFNGAMEKTMTELRVPLVARSADGASFNGRNTSVSLYAHAEQESTAYVCTTVKSAKEWQAVSARTETVILGHGTINRAHIQLDPDSFDCGNSGCMVDMPAPIDFAAFNSGKMTLPPYRTLPP
jgi:hypothetical protein